MTCTHHLAYPSYCSRNDTISCVIGELSLTTTFCLLKTPEQPDVQRLRSSAASDVYKEQVFEHRLAVPDLPIGHGLAQAQGPLQAAPGAPRCPQHSGRHTLSRNALAWQATERAQHRRRHGRFPWRGTASRLDVEGPVPRVVNPAAPPGSLWQPWLVARRRGMPRPRAIVTAM